MKKLLPLLSLLVLMTFLSIAAVSQEKEKPDSVLTESTFKGLELRNIGPAFMSGRIADIAIHPEDESTWYVAVGSGGVWKTTNAGVTWKSVFDSQPVYSIGCVTIDPHNPHRIWVGSGENVGGRHVGFGDGIYLSKDDGRSWKNMGLKKSEHISKIIVHPENPDIVFVAVQGPLWSKGGQRGFYKTTDGGETWKRTLGDDEWTGVTDILIDPRNPDRLYAATWQRHRTIAAYMGGGPESGIYRSEDGGESWTRLKKGLPSGSIGKIGLAISPQKPDEVYAAVEEIRQKGAVYKSWNRGASWKKMSNTVSGATGPHYYQELYASPHEYDKIFLMDVRTQVSEDGGKTFYRMKESRKHSDNHAMAFKQSDPDYMLMGTDGGLYESFDRAKNWRFISNLPVTQFYKIAVDDAAPFYWVYGGTQDNATEGAPTRTDKRSGITNADWEIVLYADGHQPATEPGNPDIMYAQWQQGNLMRIDRKTGEKTFIQPQPREGEGYERFNWDCPVIVSEHSPTRIYHASHRLWRSDDRGGTWETVSGDLTNHRERLDMPIMGRKQSWDSPWDVDAMSTYNTITTIAESPLDENLLFVGTDDGLLQITEDGGKNWHEIKVEDLPGVGGIAYVNDIKADRFDPNVVYLALDRHKFGDFKPYLFKSTDKGKTWKSITSNLKTPQIVWQLVQDHKAKDLLFAATEFGLYFTVDGGEKWIKLNTKANIAFRDVVIQRRENDLVGGSFGRGIFILDDYSPLREVSLRQLEEEATLFTPRDAWWYLQQSKESGATGADCFRAPNPPFGTVFTYYLKEGVKTLEQKRKESEKDRIKNKQDIDFPGWEKLDKELAQEKPSVFVTVLDKNKKVVNRLNGLLSKGMHRINWDLSFVTQRPVQWFEDAPQHGKLPGAYMVAPGTYHAFLSRQVDGQETVLSDTVSFEVKPLRERSLKGADPQSVADFWKELDNFNATVREFELNLENTRKKVSAMTEAYRRASSPNPEIRKELHDLLLSLKSIRKEIYGSPAKREVGEKNHPTLRSRMRAVISGVSQSTYGPTPTHLQTFEIAKADFESLSQKLTKIRKESVPKLMSSLEEIGAPVIEN